MSKKPDGFGAFQILLGKLAKVPKKELDREVAKQKKQSVKRKK